MHERLKAPPMGWNSWDCYGAAVTEKEFLANAEYLSKRLLQFGYDTAVCDIQWYEPTAASNEYHPFARLCTDAFSRVIPAENRFPSAKNGVGFRKIADDCHKQGLKFGIHIMRGIPRQAVHENTPILGTDARARDIAAPFSVCPWNTDMYGVNADAKGAREYYNSIFTLYAEWGVDFVKCDDIANTELFPENPYSAKKEIELIRGALDACGRDMTLSLSPGPAPRSEAEHLARHADMWRISGDFWDDWEKLYEMFGHCGRWQGVSDKGGFPDCDILPLGRLCVNAPFLGEKGRAPRLTSDELTTLVTLWAIFRSPLFIGGELESLDSFPLSLLTNREVLSMVKASRGARELFRRETETGGEIAWLSENDGAYYLAVFNTRNEAARIVVPLVELPAFGGSFARELWENRSYPLSGRAISFNAAPHGARLFKFSKVN